MRLALGRLLSTIAVLSVASVVTCSHHSLLRHWSTLLHHKTRVQTAGDCCARRPSEGGTTSAVEVGLSLEAAQNLAIADGGGGVCACVCEVGVRVRVGKWCRETVASGGLCPPELLSMVGVDTNTEGNEASAMHAGVRAVTCSYVVSRLHAMYK